VTPRFYTTDENKVDRCVPNKRPQSVTKSYNQLESEWNREASVLGSPCRSNSFRICFIKVKVKVTHIFTPPQAIFSVACSEGIVFSPCPVVCPVPTDSTAAQEGRATPLHIRDGRCFKQWRSNPDANPNPTNPKPSITVNLTLTLSLTPP